MRVIAVVLLTLFDVVSNYTIYINDSCNSKGNSKGTCLHTWTKPVFDEKQGGTVCKCQSAYGGDGSYNVNSFGSDSSDGP